MDSRWQRRRSPCSNRSGYRSDKRLALTPNTAAQFQVEFDPHKQLNAEKALIERMAIGGPFVPDHRRRDPGSHAGTGAAFQQAEGGWRRHQSYLFFAVGLKGSAYTRTQLATATREINKLFPMPVMVLFQYDQALTLAIITRRLT